MALPESACAGLFQRCRKRRRVDHAGPALALFGCSGAIRALALRADWWARGTAGLLLRLALSVALGAAVAQLLVNIALHSALAGTG